jgi:hypothetical protein
MSFLKLCAGLMVGVTTTFAQWPTDGHVVCDTSSNVTSNGTWPSIITDTRGGVFVCWADTRTSKLEVYFQHVDSSGQNLLRYNGLPVVYSQEPQTGHYMVGDGRGGAFIAWGGHWGGSIYPSAQRLDTDGHRLWQDEGIRAAETDGIWIQTSLSEDGGLLMAWSRVYDAVVQKLDANGHRVWGDTGISLTERPGDIYPVSVAVAPDARGGAIVAWVEGLSYSYGVVYVQRIDRAGIPQWQADGIALTSSVRSFLSDVAICSDNHGGAILCWANSTDITMYAQRVDSAGVIRWTPGGLALGSAGSGGGQRITADGSGGAFIGHGKYIQHVDSNGIKLWLPQGVQYTTLQTVESTQAPSPDGGIWNFWKNFIDGVGFRVYGQWIDGSGRARWGPNGIPVTNVSAYQETPQAVADGLGHVFVCWADTRRGNSAVYLSKFDTLGIITGVAGPHSALPFVPELRQNYPNPFNPETSIGFTLPRESHVKLDIFDSLGRIVKNLVDATMHPGKHEVKFKADGKSSGIYFYRLSVDGRTVNRKMILLH